MRIRLNPKFLSTSLRVAAKYLISIIYKKGGEIYVQRSSLDEGVEPQANGGGKILVLNYFLGMTHDLRTFCNGSDMEMTMQSMLRID